MKKLLLLAALGLTIGALKATDLQLQWDPAAPRAGETISYRVYQLTSPTNWTLLSTAPSTNHYILNVAPGTYTFGVSSINQYGRENTNKATAVKTLQDIEVTPPNAVPSVRIIVIVNP